MACQSRAKSRYVDQELRRISPLDSATAFANHPHSDQREGWIVKRLRAGQALTLSLVADKDGQIVGHIAFSPVQVGGASAGWHGLGPVAVRPEWQGQGIGSALINAGLERLRELGSNGCVVLGEPEFYERLAFKAIRDCGSTVCRLSCFSSFRSTMSSRRAASITTRPSLKLLTSRDD